MIEGGLLVNLDLKNIWFELSGSNPPRKVPEEEDVQGEVKEAVKIKHY